MVKEVHFSLLRTFPSESGPSKDNGSVTDADELGPSTSGARGSFSLGPKSRRSSSVACDSGTDTEELFTLLTVADATGTCPRLLKAIATALESNVEENEMHERFTSSTVGSQHMLPTGRLTVFHGLRPPPIGLQAYLERVAKYTKCSPVCFIMALTYMDTLAQRDPAMLPTSLSVHRLLLSGVMLAAKLTDDHYFNNAFYGRVGGVSVQEVNRLELELLRLLDYRLAVPWEEVRAVMRQLLAGSFVVGQGEGGYSSGSLGRKRRSASGHSHTHSQGSEKRSSARRSSMSYSQHSQSLEAEVDGDSSAGGTTGPGTASASASAPPSATPSQYYDPDEDEELDEDEDGEEELRRGPCGGRAGALAGGVDGVAMVRSLGAGAGAGASSVRSDGVVRWRERERERQREQEREGLRSVGMARSEGAPVTGRFGGRRSEAGAGVGRWERIGGRSEGVGRWEGGGGRSELVASRSEVVGGRWEGGARSEGIPIPAPRRRVGREE